VPEGDIGKGREMDLQTAMSSGITTFALRRSGRGWWEAEGKKLTFGSDVPRDTKSGYGKTQKLKTHFIQRAPGGGEVKTPMTRSSYSTKSSNRKPHPGWTH